MKENSKIEHSEKPTQGNWAEEEAFIALAAEIIVGSV